MSASPSAAPAVPAAPIALYASAGSTLFHYDIDIEAATLKLRDSVKLPVGLQYAWRHPRLAFLYVACSNGSPGVPGDVHSVIALRIDGSGALQPHGDAVPLPARPIHITTDVPGEHVLIAFNQPSGLTVHRIRQNGTLSSALEQQAPPDVGVFAHQVRVTPDNNTVILVTRGNDSTGDRAEEPGALKVFDYQYGALTNKASIAPRGGKGYGPRHLDFHPTQPWMYVSLERQNRLHVYRMKDGTPESAPAYALDTLADPQNVNPAQRAGTLHVHPNGRFLYLANRASGSVENDGRPVFAGGENNIAVFSLSERAGKPALIQHVESGGFVPRTFAIDPSGRLLVVANAQALAVKSDAGVQEVPANLSVFTIGEDGTLAFVAKHDVDTAQGALFWTGLIELPARPHYMTAR